MPESVTDRPTKSHEYLFLLSKNQRYYYDAESIKEDSIHAGKKVTIGEKSLSRGQQTAQGFDRHWGTGSKDFIEVSSSRNKRTVWTIPTKPFPGNHFAVFQKLVEPCILAGCPRYVCEECGKPITESYFNDRIVLEPHGSDATKGQPKSVHIARKPSWRRRDRITKYCSQKCYYASIKNPEWTKAWTCSSGKTFQQRDRSTRFCSKSAVYRGLRKIGQQPREILASRDMFWYIAPHPDVSAQGYVMEHRLAGKTVGRRLLRTGCASQKWDKIGQSSENLELITTAVLTTCPNHHESFKCPHCGSW